MLQALRRDYSFVLIGGWAVWLYTRRFKSKDIDIIVDMATLTKLKTHFPVTKNNRLFKYEAVQEEIQIDIYVPFWSHLGIPAEEVQAQAILEMQLQRLTALEQDKLDAEYAQLLKKIEICRAILASEKKILKNSIK